MLCLRVIKKFHAFTFVNIKKFATGDFMHNFAMSDNETDNKF